MVKNLVLPYKGTITFIEKKEIDPLEETYDEATLIEKKVRWEFVNNKKAIYFNGLAFGDEFFSTPLPEGEIGLQGSKRFDFVDGYFKYMYIKEGFLQCIFDLFRSGNHYCMFGSIHPYPFNNPVQLRAHVKEFQFFGKFVG